MNNKVLLVFLLVLLIAGSAFSQRQHKHESGNMLFGIDVGMGITPTRNFAKLASESVPSGNYAFTFDLGLNLDYYLFSWLSINSGLLMHSGMYLLLDGALFFGGDKFYEYAYMPICLTVPIMAHINVPFVEWLYLGAGVHLNFPVSTIPISNSSKGDFFIGVPIDLGFDFIKAGKGGSRFFFRVTPEFHYGKTPILIGFMWQMYNFKLR